MWRDGEDAETNDRIANHGYYSLFTVRRKPAMMYLYVGNRQGGFDMVEHDFGDRDVNLNLGPYTGDDATWRLVQGWLKRCVDTHHDCNRKTNPGYIPDRLVEFDHTSSTPTFRVAPRDKISERTQYLTLSHYWGQHQGEEDRLLLTQGTYERLTEKRPISKLPKTFREAGEVAARLGFRYIWIDALCAFQDTEPNWRADSTVMAEVYRSSYLTLGALGSSGDDGGLFFSRDPAKVQTTVFNFEVDGPGLPKPYRFSLDKGWSWVLSFTREPLVRRAWVVQERLFSPRVLLVFWECYDAACSETHPITVSCSDGFGARAQQQAPIQAPPAPQAPKPHHFWKDLLGAPSRLSGSPDDLQALFSDWHAILMLYANCELTFSGDKLLAVSGLAKDMKRYLAQLGCDDTGYLAGIWHARLPQALVWNVRELGTRPVPYRAPSWSWAAVDAHTNMQDWIRRPDPSIEIVADVISASTDPLDPEDETGAVKAGVITLRGKLFAADLRPDFKTELFNEAMRRVRNVKSAETGEVLFSVPDDIRDGFYQWLVMFDTREDISGEVFCLPITHGESKTFSGQREWYFTGIALQKVEDDGCYRRVGSLNLNMVDERFEPVFGRLEKREVSVV
ncbi:HET-domain-containing protein [Xylariaceae sp. FL0594]|nr:HET-domain-containing protein [Xylariaceae sp. FL0594]